MYKMEFLYHSIYMPSPSVNDAVAFFCTIREYGGTEYTCQIFPPMME